jgi:hypothetical protein
MIDQIIEDCFRVPIILNSEAGHGKSTSLKTIISDLKRKHPETIVKVFDISLSWYGRAPLQYRQKITTEKFLKVDFRNLDDCVYEIGSLPKDLRRVFVALIVKQDHAVRYAMVEQYGLDAIKKVPPIIYVFEEANTYFDSYSLRKNDDWSSALSDFVSVGRNFRMRGFLVVTAEQGELSPGFRRRATGRLLGRVLNEYDLTQICKGRIHMKDKLRKVPPYHWIYYHGSFSNMFRINDTVRDVPKTYAPPTKSVPPVVVESSKRGVSPWVVGFVALVAGVLLAVWLL